MITLAFGQMIYFIATSLALYGGDNGLTVASRNTIAGLPLIKTDLALYYMIFLFLLGTYLFCRALVSSRFGRVLRGGKVNATRISTMGFDIKRYQLVTYVISGGLAGLSGFPARQFDRIRQSGLHVMAAVRRTHRHGHSRRRRHTRRRHHRQRRLSSVRSVAIGIDRKLENGVRGRSWSWWFFSHAAA